MTAEPIDTASSQDTGPYEVIHLGGEAAVVVPLDDFRRLQALEQLATEEVLENAEDLAALQDWRTREAAGQTSYASSQQVRQRLGLAG